MTSSLIPSSAGKLWTNSRGSTAFPEDEAVTTPVQYLETFHPTIVKANFLVGQDIYPEVAVALL